MFPTDIGTPTALSLIGTPADNPVHIPEDNSSDTDTPNKAMPPLQVKILREGGEDSELFEQLLLDEPDGHDNSSAAAGGNGGFGLVQFLEHVATEAALQLQHEAQQAGPGGQR